MFEKRGDFMDNKEGDVEESDSLISNTQPTESTKENFVDVRKLTHISDLIAIGKLLNQLYIYIYLYITVLNLCIMYRSECFSLC